jgi:hypothetical protein
MRLILVMLLMIAGMSFANDALPDVLEARADYVSCDVDYAKDWLSMRESCGIEENVSVFDSSSYVEELEDDLEDLYDAAEDGNRFSFGLNILEIAGDSLKLIGEVVKDALDHKTFAFFSCVREGEPSLKDDRTDCREDAIDKEKIAAEDYVNFELDAANDEIQILDAKGVKTSGMEETVEYGEELVDDIDSAYSTYDPQEIQKLHLRHSRIVFLFRAEQMLAVINYAEPIIEASNNDNKEEILERGDELRDDVEDLLEICEYSDEVEVNSEYAKENLECWEDGMDSLKEFNDLRWLILEGA